MGKAVLATTVQVKGNPGDGIREEKTGRIEVGQSIPHLPGAVAMANIQWHPKDFGTLMETEEQWPPAPGGDGAWMPAGNGWQQRYRSLNGNGSSVCQVGRPFFLYACPPTKFAGVLCC